MKNSDRVIVLKFGGSVLDGPAGCRSAVHEIYRYIRDGYRVVAVTSAFRGETDELFTLAREVSEVPCAEGTAALVRTGELRSASALVLACDGAGLTASLLEPQHANLSVVGEALDSDPVSVDVGSVRAALEAASVVVVPGYHGHGDDGKPRLLGRGGTDLTALFLADALDAPCRLIKDVDAWYDAGSPLKSLHLDDAARRRDRVVQIKAASYAASKRIPFTIARVGDADGAGTVVGLDDTRHSSKRPLKPQRVAIAGVGVVGSGAWYHLGQATADFEVVGGLVRDIEQERDPWIQQELLVTSPSDLPEHDLLVEALPSADAAYALVVDSLRRGVSVVTANKALVATHGEELLGISGESGAELRYSAAVGGGCPVLEYSAAVNAHTPVRRVRAILNATTNFVLDEIAAGQSLEEAVSTAQERGFAEADPSSDLSGLDAAYKLVILVHTLTGRWLDVGTINRDDLLESHGRAGRLKQVATLEIPKAGTESQDAVAIEASVCLESVSDTDPLRDISGNWNAVVLETADGSRSVVGRGAGRWPTAESVVADVFGIRRLKSQSVAFAEAC